VVLVLPAISNVAPVSGWANPGIAPGFSVNLCHMHAKWTSSSLPSWEPLHLLAPPGC